MFHRGVGYREGGREFVRGAGGDGSAIYYRFAIASRHLGGAIRGAGGILHTGERFADGFREGGSDVGSDDPVREIDELLRQCGLSATEVVGTFMPGGGFSTSRTRVFANQGESELAIEKAYADQESLAVAGFSKEEPGFLQAKRAGDAAAERM